MRTTDGQYRMHRAPRGGTADIEVDGAESESRTRSRIAVAAFSRGRRYLGTPASTARHSTNQLNGCTGGLWVACQPFVSQAYTALAGGERRYKSQQSTAAINRDRPIASCLSTGEGPDTEPWEGVQCKSTKKGEFRQKKFAPSPPHAGREPMEREF